MGLKQDTDAAIEALRSGNTIRAVWAAGPDRCTATLRAVVFVLFDNLGRSG